MVPQGAVVDGKAAPLEQQQLVEGVDDVDGRLVDGADHGAPRVDLRRMAHAEPGRMALG